MKPATKVTLRARLLEAILDEEETAKWPFWPNDCAVCGAPMEFDLRDGARHARRICGCGHVVTAADCRRVHRPSLTGNGIISNSRFFTSCAPSSLPVRPRGDRPATGARSESKTPPDAFTITALRAAGRHGRAWYAEVRGAGTGRLFFNTPFAATSEAAEEKANAMIDYILARRGARLGSDAR